MSWMPAQDPVLGDKRSCDALDLIIVPRVRDLGDGFAVRRALPHGKRQMVGPFIFFDQMGPVQFIAGQGMDVRPHPHIGLATVTYLFDGRVMHRDSEGNALEITPGRDEPHDRRARHRAFRAQPAAARARAARACSAFKAGSRLPQAQEETDPSFQHFDAASLPVIEDDGVSGARDCRLRFRQERRRSACCRNGSTPKSCSRPAPARRSIPIRRSGRSMWSRARSRSRATHSRGRGF